MMVFKVFTCISKQFQILNFIIYNITIDMMDYLSFLKKPFKMIFYYKTMFKNIASFITKRMVRRENINIPFFTFVNSTFPHRTLFTFKSSNSCKTHIFSPFFGKLLTFSVSRFSNLVFTFTLIRTIFALPFFMQIQFNIKMIIAKFASFYKSCFFSPYVFNHFAYTIPKNKRCVNIEVRRKLLTN